MPVSQPPTAIMRSSATALELARGAAVAEADNMTSSGKEAFYLGESSAVVELRLAEPTDDQLVLAMLKMIEGCPERKQAFVDVGRASFKCSSTAFTKKAARKVRVAERVRAALDGGKSLQTNGTIVVGDWNATRFATALGQTHEPARNLAELRTFLSSHFASTVKRVFIWLDLPADGVVADVFVSSFAEAVRAAAAWEHVVFVVLPPPYTEVRMPSFETFMDRFNQASPQLSNVDGYRFTRALGANELFVDSSSVYPEGKISIKGAQAAVKFLKKYCSWLILEQSPQPSSSYSGNQRQNHPNDASLHVVRGGKVAKNPARGAPSRGGGGANSQRGRGNHQGHGRGNQQNVGKRHRGFNLL